ncbi:VOC family protein [Cytobacillus sp. NCCP-133]|uniref:VOC family protein n=1 Tax=Cytobacillus sp. NCCP-133 TaxID=766848 RepID=UPI00222EAC2A|nr:VOC family protein [Cytobacillus sp. NCCP-133]GLB60562.1 methylmalonyl-CoA epimerase [Cytobacillus sp. NCCP-133]
MGNIDHIVFAVKDLEKSKQLFSAIFKGKFIKELDLPEQNARAAYFLLGEVIIGFETPLSSEGDLYKFLEKKGEGLHHIALKIKGYEELHNSLLKNEVNMIGSKESHGVKKEFFTHPKSSLGLLLQLIEWEQPYKDSLEKRIEILGDE